MNRKELKALAQEILDYAVSKGFNLPKNRKHFNNIFGKQDYYDGEYDYDAILEFDYDANRSQEFGMGSEEGQLENFWDYTEYNNSDSDKATFTACITFDDEMPDESNIYPYKPFEDEEGDDYMDDDDSDVKYYVELPVLSVIDYLPGSVNLNADNVGFELIPQNKEFIYTVIDKFVENVGKYQQAIKNCKVADKLVEIGKDFK